MKLVFKHEDLKELQDRLEKAKNVRDVKVATAFISNSDTMLATLNAIKNQNSLEKNHFEIYLSPDFATTERKIILDKLCTIASVYIVDDLHAKVYWIQGDTNIFSFGSSNYTQKGFNKNLELMSIIENGNIDVSIQSFFDYCKEVAILVDEEVINKFNQMDEINKEIEASDLIKMKKKELEKIKKDLFNSRKLDESIVYGDISEFYFKQEDYEVFNKHNSFSDDPAIKSQRKETLSKILEIDKDIAPKLKNIGLEHHYRPANIANSIIRNETNNFRVNWLGVRYWNNTKKLQATYASDTSSTKYANLQYNLENEEFEIGLFHAVKDGAIDRIFLRKNIENIKDKIIEQLDSIKMQTTGFKWYIHDGENDIAVFELDNHDSQEFINFYKNYDKEGTFSSFMIKFESNNQSIKTKSQIEELIVKYFKLIYNLYILIIDHTNYRNL
jgi:hypothetical protein